MSFPTRWRRRTSGLSAYSEAQRRGRFFDDFFGAPLWTPPWPPSPAYSCRGAPCAWNLNEVAGAADGAAPRQGGHPQPTASAPGRRCGNSSAPLCMANPAQPGQPCTAQLLRARHGPNVGSHSHSGFIRGITNRFPTLSSPAGSGTAVGCLAVTDVTANRFGRSAASCSVVSAFLNLLPFLKLRESCSTGHLLHYHILGEYGEGVKGGGSEGGREGGGHRRWGEG